MNRTLFKIGEDIEALIRLTDEVDGDISNPEVAAAFDAWFKELEINQGVKLDGYRAWLRLWRSELAVAKAMKEQYQTEERTLTNKIEDLKRRIKEFMERTKQDKLSTPEMPNAFALQNNGGVLPIVPEDWSVGLDPKTIPERFRKQIVDTEAVRMALEAGESLDFAALGDRGRHVRIK